MENELTFEEAKKVIEEYGTDEDQYICDNIRHFMDEDGDPDDDSITLSSYFKKCLQIIIGQGIKANHLELPIMPKIVEDIAKLLLTEVMKCEMKHDENEHAYLKVPSHSLFDLGNQISEFLQSDSNFSYSENAGQFEKAYNHAMTVLTKYILKVERDGDKIGKKHYLWKAHSMKTAKSTIEENIRMYLKHLDLYNKIQI